MMMIIIIGVIIYLYAPAVEKLQSSPITRPNFYT